MENYQLCHAEHTAMKNYANVPDAWHTFAETGQSGKINLTTFHKAIYDYIDGHHIPYELTRYKKQVKFDEELSSILKVPELLVEEIQNHVAYLVSTIVELNSAGHTTFVHVQDAIKAHVVGKEHMTVQEFEEATGIPITRYVQEDDEDGNEDDENDNKDDEEQYDIKQGYHPLRMSDVLNDLETLIPFRSGIYRGFAAPMYISVNLSKFLNTPSNTYARTGVTTEIIRYIQKQKLEDPNNRRIICPDAKLETIVGDSETRLRRMQQRKDQLMKKSAKDPDNVKWKKKAELTKVTDTLTYFNLQIHLNDQFTCPLVSGLRILDHWNAILDEIVKRKREDEIVETMESMPTMPTMPTMPEPEPVWKRFKTWFSFA